MLKLLIDIFCILQIKSSCNFLPLLQNTLKTSFQSGNKQWLRIQFSNLHVKIKREPIQQIYIIKALYDANKIRYLINFLFLIEYYYHSISIGFFEVLVTNTSKKPTLKWNIFVIILRIILASN